MPIAPLLSYCKSYCSELFFIVAKTCKYSLANVAYTQKLSPSIFFLGKALLAKLSTKSCQSVHKKALVMAPRLIFLVKSGLI